MSTRKKAALAAAATVGTILVVLLVLPLLFGGRIEERIRSEVEQAVALDVSWESASVSFFRAFPNPTLSLAGLAAVGTNRFEGDTLASVDHVRVALNGGSVVRALRGTGPLVVRSVRIEAPDLRLKVEEDGLRSWDIMRDREGGADDGEGAPGRASTDGALSVSLNRLAVSDGRLSLDNDVSGLVVEASGISHSLRGDFSRESLVAATDSRAEDVTIVMAGVPYLIGSTVDFEADFDVDVPGRRARLVDNTLAINDLLLRVEGEVAQTDDVVEVDLDFEAPATDFGQLLSLVPVIYANDFESVETTGTFALRGSAEGRYGPGTVPAFSLDATVQDATFRYPDLPLPAEEIRAALSVSNPGGDLDATVVDLSDFHVSIADQPIEATASLRTPLSDPAAEVSVVGTLDLADLGRTVKFDAAQELTGVVVADARIRARRSDIENASYENVVANGTISARSVALRSPALRQPVDVHEATIRLTPRAGQLESFDARLGSSDLQASARLDNLLGFILGQETLQGSGTFSSRRFLLDEWRSDDELRTFAVPAMLDLRLDGTFDELVFNDIEMRNARGRATVRERRVTFEDVSLEALGGRIDVDGFYEAPTPEPASFALDLMLDSLDVSQASEALLTVRTLAPVATYARGSFSSAMNLTGTLGEDMTPVLDVLDGNGTLSTSSLAIEGLPILQRLAETLDLQRLSNPTVGAVRSTVRIQDGRLVVDPFQVPIEGVAMTVSGSNGIDQSIDYSLGLRIPRTGVAEGVISTLASRTGPLGASLATLDTIRVAIRATGSVRDPSLAATLSETTQTARNAAVQATEAAVDERIDEARERAEAERAAARQRAGERADSILAEAERRAEVVRTEAAAAAERIRAEGNRAADEALARATSPLARAAAQPLADRLRREAEERATQLQTEADEQATAIVEAARERADAIRGGSG